MKYKVTSLIVCTLIAATVLFLSCEKNPVAPQATSEDLTLKSTKTRNDETGWVQVYNLGTYNDHLGSLRVPGDTAGESYVILYKDVDYKGTRELFIADDPNFDGWLGYKGNDIGNDKVSSVKLVRGARCTLYSNSRFGGYEITLTESCPNLKTKIRGRYYYKPPGSYLGRWITLTWNDCASSIKVDYVTARGVVLYEHNYAAEYGSHPGRSTVLLDDLPYPYYGYSMLKLVNLSEYEVPLYLYEWYYIPIPYDDLQRIWIDY